MKKQILLSLAVLQALAFSLHAQNTFQKKYAASYSNAFLGTSDISVLQTFDGNYCVAGTVDVNNGDIYLMKLDVNGDTIWTRTFGGNFDDVVFSVEQTSDSGFILSGQTRSFSLGNTDAYLIKTTSNGDLVWSKNYGGFDYDWFSSIYPTSDNGFIASGTTSTFGSGIQDVYLVKLDSVGGIQWTKTLGGGGWDRSSSVRPTFDNGYIITGSTTSFTATSGRIYLIKTDATGNPVWSQIFGGVMGEGGHSVRQCADSGFVVTGYTNSFGAGAQDVFLLKTDLSGTLQWMKTYGGVWEDIGYNMEVTNDGGFIVTGRTQSSGPGLGSTRNVYLFKTNSVGDTVWTRCFGSVINNGYSVKQTADNSFIIATNTDNFTVIKTDSLGHVGCNEYGTNTIVNSVSPVILTGALTGSGGTANTASTITRYTPTTIDTICVALGTGVEEVADNSIQLSVYPNPFTDVVTFYTSERGELEIMLFDILSRKLMTETFSGSVTLNVSSLEKGIYAYRLTSRNRLLQNGKVIKQ